MLATVFLTFGLLLTASAAGICTPGTATILDSVVGSPTFQVDFILNYPFSFFLFFLFFLCFFSLSTSLCIYKLIDCHCNCINRPSQAVQRLDQESAADCGQRLVHLEPWACGFAGHLSDRQCAADRALCRGGVLPGLVAPGPAGAVHHRPCRRQHVRVHQPARETAGKLIPASRGL
jgi:hypothetical protein